MNDEDDFFALANHVADDTTVIDVSDGRYFHWASDCGAEIWLQVNEANELIGMNPHFAGESRVRVGIISRITRRDDTALDGAFQGWADPSGDDPQDGIYPFVFDSPDYRRHSKLTIPSIVPVQIAAFAQEVLVFDSVDAYDTSQASETKLASQSFIPSGLFPPNDGLIQTPQAFGILTGHIAKAEKRENRLSGHSFYWVLVDSLGGLFDVVIDPELVQNEPKLGGVLTGSFWLSGIVAQ